MVLALWSMPTIQFDVLCPPAAAPEIAGAFQRALDILVSHGRLESGSAREELPGEGIELVDASVDKQLRAVYETDRGTDPDADGATVHRFVIEVAGATSYNSLAMGLSRILTPKVELPKDPVQLEAQDRFETASIYPWVVEVRR